MELRFMWWQVVIYYSYKSYDNCRSQELALDEQLWAISLIVCSLEHYYKIHSNFHIHEKKLKNDIVLEFFSLCKKNNFQPYSS